MAIEKMTPQEVLAQARAGDTASLANDPDSVTAAVHAFVASRETAAALEIVGRCWRVWSSSGRLADGRAAAAAALTADRGDAGVWRARALYGDGVIAFREGDNVASRSRNDEVLELARSTGDVRGECDALTGLARVALRAGDYEEVVRLARSARDKARVAGDLDAEAAPLHLEAAGTRLLARYEDARALYVESLERAERKGASALMAMERHNLGWVDLHSGDVDAAERWFRERDAASPPDGYGDAWVELNWAAVALARGRRDEAEHRFTEGKAALDRLGVALDPDDRFEVEWLERELRGSRC
jgi:tetratricopeptide (TPR) repeat protein